MAKYGFIIIVAVLVAVTFQEAEALKCWRCSSDATNGAFCDDPFDSSVINEQTRRWAYVECSFPPNQVNPFNQAIQTRSVCKKVKQAVNGKTVVSRSCFWEDVNAPRDACTYTSTPSYVKVDYCQTCTTDGCNGATQYGPVALLVAIPALIAKMLHW